MPPLAPSHMQPNRRHGSTRGASTSGRRNLKGVLDGDACALPHHLRWCRSWGGLLHLRVVRKERKKAEEKRRKEMEMQTEEAEEASPFSLVRALLGPRENTILPSHPWYYPNQRMRYHVVQTNLSHPTLLDQRSGFGTSHHQVQ